MHAEDSAFERSAQIIEREANRWAKRVGEIGAKASFAALKTARKEHDRQRKAASLLVGELRRVAKLLREEKNVPGSGNAAEAGHGGEVGA